MAPPKDTKKDDIPSDSSAITMPMRPYIVDTPKYGTSPAEISPEETHPPVAANQLVAVWWSVVALWRSFTAYLYTSTVGFCGNLVADVMTHPRVRRATIDVIVTAINAFVEQEDIGERIDGMARRTVYDSEKARDASHALGKEVVPMLTGFMGGVASSFQPSSIKQRKERRKTKKLSSMRESDGHLGDVSTHYYHSSGGVLSGDDRDDEDDDSNWFSSSKKSK